MPRRSLNNLRRRLLTNFCIFFADPVSSTTSDDEENEFYDAQELSEDDGTFCLKIPATRSLTEMNGGSSSESEELNSCEAEPVRDVSKILAVPETKVSELMRTI